MDKIWDIKSVEVGDHWPLWRGWKKRMTTHNRQKSNAKNKTVHNISLHYSIWHVLLLLLFNAIIYFCQVDQCPPRCNFIGLIVALYTMDACSVVITQQSNPPITVNSIVSVMNSQVSGQCSYTITIVAYTMIAKVHWCIQCNRTHCIHVAEVLMYM